MFHSNGEECDFEMSDKLVFGKNLMSIDNSHSMHIDKDLRPKMQYKHIFLKIMRESHLIFVTFVRWNFHTGKGYTDANKTCTSRKNITNAKNLRYLCQTKLI